MLIVPRNRSCIRWLGSTSRTLARSTEVDSKVKQPNPKKVTRQEKMARVNMTSQSKLYHINSEFEIFNSNVTKILDLGYAPGNWLAYSKLKMCEIYDLNEAHINEKCQFLGFDILVGVPPSRTSSLQGNIFSKSSHKEITDRFKELALERVEAETTAETKESDLEKPSYYVDEQSESKELEELEKGLENLTLEKELDYKPELILSDISYPFMQEKGFYQNTNTKPHLRLSSNPVLSRPIVHKTKSAIDMADASLVLACDLLKKGGTLVIRMASVNLDDPELDVVNDRLLRVFNSVHERQLTSGDDLFFICLDKKEDVADKKRVFSK